MAPTRRFPLAPLLVALLALLAGACAPDGETFALDPNMSSAQAAATERALEKWNGVAVRRMTVAENATWFIRIAPPRCEAPGEFSGCAHGKDDPIHELRHVIEIPPGLPEELFYRAVLHEIGHAMGLPHTTEGVMTPAVLSEEFTPEDIAACRRVGACW